MRLEVVLCVQSAMANSDGTELLHGQNVHRVVSEEEGETDKEHQEEEEEEEKKHQDKKNRLFRKIRRAENKQANNSSQTADKKYKKTGCWVFNAM